MSHGLNNRRTTTFKVPGALSNWSRLSPVNIQAVVDVAARSRRSIQGLSAPGVCASRSRLAYFGGSVLISARFSTWV